jgi:thiamine-triphosphatase
MDISPPAANNATFVEVERRFVISEKCYENLENCGAKLKKRLSFCDVYYDTPDHDLILNDYWLRCRDEQWQLKCPPPKRSGSDAQTLQYAEYDGIQDVFRHLKSVLVPHEAQTEHVPTERARDRPVVDGTVSRCSNENGSIVDVTSNSQFVDYLALCKCQPIARFRTERTKYTMGDDVTIDIDTADFGYSIGEIETLVAIGT